ncbi:hypothetical protein [Oceanobacillus bengalensis]|uniref:DUF5050 domain-containing protein n=1 Tax=Oceanobacillus bengalensis TaxID=1435466 RepID=A0A494Z2X1_9BACI|nr:hypothetical protein [Oceanobacillus bengalensis]RKQ16833.1 hypothetical protein D8M05_06155 [Oceanobacillus bengalensis]
MKRYLKLISMIIVVVLVIGAFYIQSGLAGSNLPEFSIETTSGNADEVESLTIHADYRDDVQGDSLQISAAGSTYNSNISFLKQLGNYYMQNDLKELQEQYKGFMRGKWSSPQEYFVDDEMVAYAEVTSSRYGDIHLGDFSFKIDVLDKQSNDSIELEMDVPEQEKFDNVNVEDVQVIDGMLKVVTRNDLYENEIQGTDFRVYTFDLQKQELINEEVIVEHQNDQQNEEKWTDISILNNYNAIQSEKYLLFKIEISELNDSAGDYEYVSTILERNFLVYNVETGEKEEFILPEEINDIFDFNINSFHETVSIEGSTVYFTNVTENGIDVYPYDIEKQELEAEQTFELFSSESTPGMYSPALKLKDGKIYFVNSFKDKQTDANIYVGDLETGDILFEGSIELKNPSAEKKGYQLHIYDVRL